MDKKTLVSILNKLLKSKIVFSNELEFQFYLAKQIQSLPDVDRVYFEAVSFDDSWNTLKNNFRSIKKQTRQYTDLVVGLKNRKGLIVIELKYKAINKSFVYGNTLLMRQGAYDIGSYSFVKDIERILKLKNKQRFFVDDLDIIKGFAILLTNDYNYRNNDLCGGKGIWRNFSISEKTILESKKLGFYIDGVEKSELYGKYNELDLTSLTSSIILDWYPKNYRYDQKKTPPDFHFLIVEI